MKMKHKERVKKSFRIRVLRFCTTGGLLLGVLLCVCVIDLPITRRLNDTVKTSLSINAEETLFGGIVEKVTGFRESRTSPTVIEPIRTNPPLIESTTQDKPQEGLSFRIDEDMLATMEGQTDLYLHNNQ